MGSPAIFSNRRTKLLTADGILTSTGRTLDYDGSINYIANNGAEVNTTGWATYADAAASTPVDGTGGSPSSTFTRSTSSPLRGQGSFLWTKSANNRQGEGFSYDFTVADSDKGKVLACSFDYGISSGTFVSADMTLWIYDVTNAVLIQPAPSNLNNHTLVSDRMFLEFQTTTSSGSYRLICHTATTSASAYTVKFDNFLLGPQAKLYGSPETDWVSYTPTFTGFGTATSIEFQSRKTGDTLQIKGKFTCGTSTGVEGRITLGFNGVSANVTSSDTGKIPSLQECGTYLRNISTAALVSTPVLVEPSVGYLTFGKMTATDSPLTKQNGNQLSSTGENFALFAQVPIQGWSSSQVVSSDASTRIIAARATGTPATATTGNPVIFPTSSFDTHGAYSTSTGRYTVQVPGYYRATVFVNATNTSEPYFIFKNAVADVRIAISQAAGQASGSGIISCVAGDIIDVRPNSAGSGTMGTGGFISFEMLTGPAQIMASDSVNARYYASATSISGSLTTISWTTKDFDSHGAMSSGTYTAPIAGKYQISTAILVSGTIALNTTLITEIQKNGTVISRNTEYAGGALTNQKGWADDIISCLAGDTIRIQISSSATLPTIVSSNFDNYFAIARVGQ